VIAVPLLDSAPPELSFDKCRREVGKLGDRFLEIVRRKYSTLGPRKGPGVREKDRIEATRIAVEIERLVAIANGEAARLGRLTGWCSFGRCDQCDGGSPHPCLHSCHWNPISLATRPGRPRMGFGVPGSGGKQA